MVLTFQNISPKDIPKLTHILYETEVVCYFMYSHHLVYLDTSAIDSAIRSVKIHNTRLLRYQTCKNNQ